MLTTVTRTTIRAARWRTTAAAHYCCTCLICLAQIQVPLQRRAKQTRKQGHYSSQMHFWHGSHSLTQSQHQLSLLCPAQSDMSRQLKQLLVGDCRKNPQSWTLALAAALLPCTHTTVLCCWRYSNKNTQLTTEPVPYLVQSPPSLQPHVRALTLCLTSPPPPSIQASVNDPKLPPW